MKQVIVMLASIMLGVAIFNLIAGPDSGSMMSSVKEVWEAEIEMRTMEP